MGFATEIIQTAGGAAPSATIWANRPEMARPPLAGGGVDLTNHWNGFHFLSQWPVMIMPPWGDKEMGYNIPPHESGPGLAIGDDRHISFRHRMMEYVRKGFQDTFTSRGPELGPLTGLPYDPLSDGEMTGTLIEPVSLKRVSPGSRMALINSVDGRIDPLQNVGQPDMAPVDNIVEQSQRWGGELSAEYSGVYADFPNVKVTPLPQTRSLFLVTASTPLELSIPDGAVLARFTWSPSTADLWLCMSGQAFIPTSAIQSANLQTGNDGVILNPDQTAYYPVRRKRQISFVSSTPNVIVNGQFFLNG